MGHRAQNEAVQPTIAVVGAPMAVAQKRFGVVIGQREEVGKRVERVLGAVVAVGKRTAEIAVAALVETLAERAVVGEALGAVPAEEIALTVETASVSVQTVVGE